VREKDEFDEFPFEEDEGGEPVMRKDLPPEASG
jgi:hypothetical protein